MADPEQKFDRFKPSAPKIPGVPLPGEAAPAPAEPASAPAPKRMPAAVLAGGVLLLLVLVALWWTLSSEPESPAPQASPAQSASPAPAAATAASPTASQGIRTAPGEVATLAELARPWAAKKFIFRKLDGDRHAALVVRLPSGSARTSQGYWAFSLSSSNRQCELEFVTDVKKLADEYGYQAQHPMVVDPCNRTIYDPLKLGDVGGAWVRGDVVAGSAIRPPLAVLVRVEGDRLIAVQME